MSVEVIKQKVLDAVGQAGIDETALDYIVGVLEDEHMRSDRDECISIIAPFLIDSGCASTEEEAAECVDRILAGFSKKAEPEKKKILAAPIKVAESNITTTETPDWMKTTERATLVNQEKAEMIAAKKERRSELKSKRDEHKKKEKYEKAGIPTEFMVSRKDTSNNSKSKDIHLENFSINLGKLVLMEDCNVTLAHGRRYGLVGRNGSGKTTLLKHIACRELDGIPSHLSILHVEQEVGGSDDTVVQCVLKADLEREQLLHEEKEILAQTDKDGKLGTALSIRLNQVYERLKEIDADGAEARASIILSGLGFTPDTQVRPTKEFSGGWRMRVSLARALFCQPDILLLDEPTNHLDLFSCLWLESYLCNWRGTILVVSHQRDFLNAISTDILHLNANKKIDHYKGDFDTFDEVRYERALALQKAFEAQQKRVKHIQTFVDRFRYNAKRASLVQSRIKVLERMTMLDEVAQDPTLIIQFPDPEDLIPPIMQFRDVKFGYGESHLFHDVNVGIDLESRVALVGANGTGKSTLLKLMSGELQPHEGMILRHPKLRFAKFSQHFVEQLGDYDVSPVEHFMNSFPGVQSLPARTHLGSFGLSGDLAIRSINSLSGGQKSRLVFAMLAWKKPHVLLLDEPTNHLDMETIDSLCQALTLYKGGVLIVSHDERLISVVCDQLWYFKDKKVLEYKGEFADYKKMLWEQVKSDLSLEQR